MTNPLQTDEHDYNINRWGDGYFRYDPAGKIEVVHNQDDRGTTLTEIVAQASQMGLQPPLLIRFSDILLDRVQKINQAFKKAITEHNYKGQYQLVYPIKVNQKFSVVTTLLKEKDYPIGLEAGSKAELMAVIGLLNQRPSTIICNGYKDASYIRLALIAQQIGHNIFIVIENHSELAIILKQSAKLKITPNLGIRIRLITKSAGKWENTGGTKSKFGLNTDQVLHLIETLKTANMLNSLTLMHCHLGSQIANINDIRHCMREVAHYYAHLRHLDAPIGTIDIGGGLAVDYEGTYSTNDCSMNYSMKEYATNILLALQPICEAANIPEPNLISESGRALTAHHAVLVCNINDVEQMDGQKPISNHSQNDFIIQDIKDTYNTLDTTNPIEAYNFAMVSLEETHSRFKNGLLSLQDKALVEQIFISICHKIRGLLDKNNPNEEAILHTVKEHLSAKIYCNMSFFNSIPDSWAIGQVFPIAPISHLHTPSKMESILYDLTCDSDGTIKQYTDGKYLSDVLMLPKYDPNDPYCIGFFLVGAYQEILGNLHNLFGNTNTITVKLLADGAFQISEMAPGATVEEVLNYAHFDTKKTLLSYEEQLMQTQLSPTMIHSYLEEIRDQFNQSTYLGNQSREHNDPT